MRKKLASVEVHDQLDLAFEKIAETTEKLNRLKDAYNETANEMSQITYDDLKAVTTPPPPPAHVPPVRVKPPPLPTGYSLQKPPTGPEQPIPPRPRVPRPEAKKTVVPPPLPPEASKPSGRFYIQLSGAEGSAEFRAAKDKLSKVGRVVDSGRGTASSPKAGWVEVAVRGDAGDVVASLRDCDLKEQVEKIIEVKPGEGRILARQLDMFRIKNTQT